MQIIFSHSQQTGFNLAAEEVLFSRRQDDILFLYVNDPSIVIGCNQALLAEVNVDFCNTQDIGVYRRMSGGGAVYHDSGNLNYCFIKNKMAGEFPLEGGFLQPIVQVLHAMEIDVHIGKRKDLWLPGETKMSGTASHIGKTRELHHGTLLYDADVEKLQWALSPKPMDIRPKGIASVPSPVKNIRAYLKEQHAHPPVASEFFEQFTKQLLDFYCLESVSSLTEIEINEIQHLQQSKYNTAEWIHKK
jgi:lipoate-protein ligase A